MDHQSKGNALLVSLAAVGLSAVIIAIWEKRRRHRHTAADLGSRSYVLSDAPALDSDKVQEQTACTTSAGSISLQDQLTVVLTTSSVPSHPSTYLLDETLQSMALASGLSKCKLLIVCDGYKLCDAGTESRSRMGIINPDSARRYEEYKQRLRERESCGEFQLLELQERHGFGFAVKASLKQVQTPYVMVMQHDRKFARSVEIEPLISIMEARPWIKYLGMPTQRTLHHEYHVLSKYGIYLQSVSLGGGLHATPLIQWYDSAHICRTEYYRDFVFGPRRLVARGGFIEDKLGQTQLHEIRTKGMDAHGEYGTYILNDGVDEPLVLHLNGRDSIHLAHAR